MPHPTQPAAPVPGCPALQGSTLTERMAIVLTETSLVVHDKGSSKDRIRPVPLDRVRECTWTDRPRAASFVVLTVLALLFLFLLLINLASPGAMVFFAVLMAGCIGLLVFFIKRPRHTLHLVFDGSRRTATVTCSKHKWQTFLEHLIHQIQINQTPAAPAGVDPATASPELATSGQPQVAEAALQPPSHRHTAQPA